MEPNRLITRRHMLITAAGSAAALFLPGCSRKLPPSYGNLLRMGDTPTYAAHRALLNGKALAKEYTRADITSFPAIGTVDPGDPATRKPNETYRQLQKGGFADWRLTIEGWVERPGSYSLSDLKRFPARTQITRQSCEEGWSAIAEWTGVPLSLILNAAGMLPSARFVSYYSYDELEDSMDLIDALHPQTMLAYGMNGNDLPVPHGAPVRMRVETQLGYRSMKYLERIVVKDDFDDGGEKGNIRNGWSWYAGI